MPESHDSQADAAHSPHAPVEQPNRRQFVKKSVALAIAGAAVATPVTAGLLVVTDPLRKPASLGMPVLITAISALPNDGKPHRFPVVMEKTDAWTKHDRVAVGQVYLIRKGDTVRALSAECPHAGCKVDALGDGAFACPCHDSEFAADGSIKPLTRGGKRTVSPRGLDELQIDADALKRGEVVVLFQKFQTGNAQKKAL